MITIPNEVFFEEVERLLSEGESVEINIKGSSMYPYLREGKDKVVVSPVRKEDLLRGAIILFRYLDRYILHRIIRCEGGTFIMKGDGVWRNQEKASQEDIIGVVHTIIRPDGRTVSTNSFSAQVYWRYRHFLRPVRRCLVAVLRRMRRGAKVLVRRSLLTNYLILLLPPQF
jgi:hypothetical protein